MKREIILTYHSVSHVSSIAASAKKASPIVKLQPTAYIPSKLSPLTLLEHFQKYAAYA